MLRTLNFYNVFAWVTVYLSGTIINKQKEGISGIIVLLKGKSGGAITDLEGQHNIKYIKSSTAKTDWQLQGIFFLRKINDPIFLLVDANDFGPFQKVWSVPSLGIEPIRRWKNFIEGPTISANTTYQIYFDTSELRSFVDFNGDRIPSTPYFFANGAAAYELTDVLKKQDKLSFFWNIRYVNSFLGRESAGSQQFKVEVPNHSCSWTHLPNEYQEHSKRFDPRHTKT